LTIFRAAREGLAAVRKGRLEANWDCDCRIPARAAVIIGLLPDLLERYLQL